MKTGVGANIAAVRVARGLSQKGLADRAHVSLSLIKKVESGHAPATQALIGAVARAMRVDVPRLTGQPYEEPGAASSGRLNVGVNAIRRAMATMDIPEENAKPQSVVTLARDVEHVSDLGKRADYVGISETLPTLLGELSVALAAAPEGDRPRLNSLLAEAYSGVSAVATLMGYLDLRDRAVDRIEDASAVCDDPLRPHRVKWQRTGAWLSLGAYQQGLRLMERTRADLGDDLARKTGPELSVYGSMHLRSAILAARAATTEGPAMARQAWDHLGEARRVATAMGRERNDYGLAFGPANVTLHEVAIAVDLEDGPGALRRPKLGRGEAALPAVRRGHYYMDLARAFVLVGDREKALHALQRARRIAPQQTRHHPMVRETALAIATSGRSTEELAAFLRWLGIA